MTATTRVAGTAAPVEPAGELPGELSEAEWTLIAPLLPPAGRVGRRRSTDMRRVVSAINYRWRTGCTWRELPPGLPPWPTVYTYFRRWYKDGTLQKVRSTLDPPVRTASVASRPR